MAKRRPPAAITVACKASRASTPDKSNVAPLAAPEDTTAEELFADGAAPGETLAGGTLVGDATRGDEEFADVAFDVADCIVAIADCIVAGFAAIAGNDTRCQ